MNKLYLSFAIDLKNDDFINGPLFNKWLPDNENDSITLDAERLKIKVWFERRGFMDDGHIRYKIDRHEVNTIVIPKQALLQGGRLFGSTEVLINEDEIKDLQNNDYERLGKQIINWLSPSISKFIEIMRTDYGQYWIKPLRKFDTRKESLGNYCMAISLRWRIDEEESWKDFIPTEVVQKITGIIYDDNFYQNYITEEDWNKINVINIIDYKPNQSKRILTSAQQKWDEEIYSEAFISIVSSLELAINDVITESIPKESSIFSHLKKVLATRSKKITFPEIVSTLFSIKGDVSLDVIERALLGIELRNKIIHDGEKASKENKKEFNALKECIKSLFRGKEFKYPPYTRSNSLDLM